MPGPVLSRTTEVLERQRSDGLHPGACLVASLDAERVGSVSVGGIGPSTVVPWYSMTKVTLAIEVAMAWERGMLALDDPVALWIPSFAAGGKATITIRHLLTHTGGFRSADQRPPLADWDAETERIAAVALEDDWVPGRMAGYSGRAGPHLLAEIVRRATGTDASWDEVVAAGVFEPLGMENCSLAGPPPDRTMMYDTSAGRPRAVPDHGGAVAPGSSGRGPVEAVARLGECLYLGGSPLLSPVTVDAVTARHRTGMLDRTFGMVVDWGLCLVLDSKIHGRAVVPYGYGAHAGPRTYGHGGRQSSGLLVDPDVGLVGVLFCSGLPGEAAHTRRVHEVWTALYEDLGLDGA